MKKLLLALFSIALLTLTWCGSVFGAEILSAECNKHGVMYPEGYNVVDEIFKFKFIATGDTKEILMNGGNGDSVIVTNPFGNCGSDETVGMETTSPIVSGVAGTRVFTFKAVGYDGSVTPYDKEIILECYNRDGKGISVLSVEAKRNIIKEVVAGHDTVEMLELTVATTLDTRELVAFNEKDEKIENISEYCRSRGNLDIIDGIKYFEFYFISPIVGERSFTFQAVNDYGNLEGAKKTINYTVIADEKWDEYQNQGGEAGSGTQPGTGEGFSSGDDKNATGNEDGVENGGKGQSDTGTNDGSEEKGENTENSNTDGKAEGTSNQTQKPIEENQSNQKPAEENQPKEESKPIENNNHNNTSNAGSCCNHEDFISLIVPVTIKAIVIEFPDGRKYTADELEEKNLAMSEYSKDGKRRFWDIWIGSEFEYDDLNVIAYDENFNRRYDFSIYETNPLTKEEIEIYEKAIENEIRIEVAPRQKIIELQIGNEYMTVDGEKREVDPGRGTKPLIIDSRTMLPIRAIVEALGGTVSWEEKTQEVGVRIFSKDIRFYIGSLNMTWNGIPDTTDVPPQVINGRTMLPIRFVTEVLDRTEITWDEKQQKVTIVYSY